MMSFRSFLEQEGQDAPYDSERSVLARLPSLDPISQAQLDMRLHNKAVNQQRFAPQDSNALQDDITHKQQLVQILQGHVADPKLIAQTVQDLHHDRQTHLNFLQQPPDPNTGSHVWHKTWAQIYENWIKLLRG